MSTVGYYISVYFRDMEAGLVGDLGIKERQGVKPFSVL